MNNTCQNCGTELVLLPPDQVLCGWCVKVIGPRLVKTRTRAFRYRVTTSEGSFDTSLKDHAIRLAREEAAAHGAKGIWVRDLKTGITLWPD